MMRRVQAHAVRGNAVGGGAAGPQRQLLQAALYSTCSSSKQWWFSSKFGDRGGVSAPSVARGVGETMFFSVAATSLARKEVVLYQYETCPLCNKVKAFLDYNKIPYKVVEVNPVSKKEIKWSDYKKVPILTVDGIIGKAELKGIKFCNKMRAYLDYKKIPYRVVKVNPIIEEEIEEIEEVEEVEEIEWSDYENKKVTLVTVEGEPLDDSSRIIDKLLDKIDSQNSTVNNEEETEWREWVDNNLVYVLLLNIYRSASEALESFNYITTHGNFTSTERIVAKYAGAAGMYFVSKKLKRRHNITDEREALYEAAETWMDALQGRKFLGGLEPNLADLAVFGVLRPIRYLQSGEDMVENTRIGEWYGEMENAMGEGSRIKA